MRLLSKSLIILLLVLFVIPSVSLVKPTFAQTTTIPSVPEFTVRYVDYSYDVPAKYGIDQYTGQNITIQAGYHVDNRSIEVTIKNQPFTPYNDSNGNYIGLYYNFRTKGHYGTQWTYFPFNPDGVTVTPWNGMIIGRGVLPYFSQSNADSTTFSFGVHDGEEDFEVQAQIGHIADVGGGTLSLGSYYNFTGDASDWSNTQTIVISEMTSTTTPGTSPPALSSPPSENQNATSVQPGPQSAIQSGNALVQLALFISLAIVAILLALIVALRLKRIRSHSEATQPPVSGTV